MEASHTNENLMKLAIKIKENQSEMAEQTHMQFITRMNNKELCE